jgi:superfamily II DNA or RNA helicase
MYDKCEIDNDLLTTQISKENVQKLLDYQIFHTINLIVCLKKNNVILDGSSTGTGKTYTSICLCKELNLEPLIICPKSIISIWASVCDYFGVHPLAIINYETIKNNKKQHDYMNINNKTYLSIDEYGNYIWKLDENNIVIMDEVHKCKNTTTLNGKLLLSLKHNIKILMLSATIADKPSKFKIFGYMLDFYPSLSKSQHWIHNIIRDDENNVGNKNSSLYEKLYPEKGSRMSIDDLGSKFPKNKISVDCYSLSYKDRKEMDKYYDKIKENKENKINLNIILECRQKIELLKIPIIIDLIDKYMESNKSIVIFVNFLDTLHKLSNFLKKEKIDHSILYGNLNNEERDIEINKFQINAVRIIICTIQTGSQSISLHDISGKNPRVSLILPSFSSIELVQALGRIYRGGIKSHALQQIIFCSDTYEKLIAENIKDKLKFYTQLSENDNSNKITLNLVESLDKDYDLFI